MPAPTGRIWQVGNHVSSVARMAARRFSAFHRSAISVTRLAVVLDNHDRRLPTHSSARSGLRASSTNLGSQEEASDLALNLRSGSLPAGVVYHAKSSTVGPVARRRFDPRGLRRRHRRAAAVIACNAGLLQALRYQCGAGSDSECDHSDGRSQLLPRRADAAGIAGVILTIGMAVDSNVLIFERIREELRAGKA